MKLKLAIIFGILIWFLTGLISSIITPIFTGTTIHFNIVTPITLIIITSLFGILYIRNIDSNEVIEGLMAGIIFIAVDIICDYVFLIIPHVRTTLTENYPIHIISMLVVTLFITTFLGYLAQMNIDLK